MRIGSLCKVFVFCALSISFWFFSHKIQAGIVQINGKWSDTKYAPTLSIPEHYDLGNQLLLDNQWEEALKNFLIIAIHFPESPFYADSLYQSGVCYFYLSDFDLANRQFSKYLNLGGNLKHFEKVFEFKYQIAQSYMQGSKKHLFGFQRFPRMMPARGEALSLYDEIIASLPTRDIAAEAMYGKACLLKKRKEYRESIETLQMLTRRFPKHSMAADAFLLISYIYLEQSQVEAQNPDLFSLAQINLNRFEKSFPGDERIAQGENNLIEMKEVFSKSLFDTGRFYERKKKMGASRIYYQEAIKRYPQTKSADKSQSRLAQLNRGKESSDKVIVQSE